MSSLAITDTRISNFENQYTEKKQEYNYLKGISHYVQSSLGTHYFFKLLINGCIWPVHFAKTLGLSERTVEKILETSAKFKFVSKNLILAKIPGSIDQLNKSYKEYREAQLEETIRKRDKLATKIFQIVCDSSILIQLGEVLSLYSLGALSPVVSFVCNVFTIMFEGTTLKINTEDYFKHSEMQKTVLNQKNPVERLVRLFHEIKNLELLKIAKSVIAIALSMFFIIDMVFKTMLISATALLFLSTTASVLAVWSHFYKETMTYPLLSS